MVQLARHGFWRLLFMEGDDKYMAADTCHSLWGCCLYIGGDDQCGSGQLPWCMGAVYRDDHYGSCHVS